MIDRTRTVVQLINLSHLMRDRLWIAAMARQTLAQVTSNACRSLCELGYDASLPTGYNQRFYNLSNSSRRQTVSMTWALDPTRIQRNNAPVSWRHFFGLIRNSGMGHCSSALFCTRNGSASSISWVEDPSTNLKDYFESSEIVVPDVDIASVYNDSVFPKVLEVLNLFGSICLMQAMMYGPEARSIPDMTPLLDQLVPHLSPADLVILNNFLANNSGIRLICRSHVARMEGTDVPGSDSTAAVGDSDAQAAEASGAAEDLPYALEVDRG